MTDKTHKLNT